jgi:hypothetical protein
MRFQVIGAGVTTHFDFDLGAKRRQVLPDRCPVPRSHASAVPAYQQTSVQTRRAAAGGRARAAPLVDPVPSLLGHRARRRAPAIHPGAHLHPQPAPRSPPAPRPAAPRRSLSSRAAPRRAAPLSAPGARQGAWKTCRAPRWRIPRSPALRPLSGRARGATRSFPGPSRTVCSRVTPHAPPRSRRRRRRQAARRTTACGSRCSSTGASLYTESWLYTTPAAPRPRPRHYASLSRANARRASCRWKTAPAAPECAPFQPAPRLAQAARAAAARRAGAPRVERVDPSRGAQPDQCLSAACESALGGVLSLRRRVPCPEAPPPASSPGVLGVRWGGAQWSK